MLQEGGRVQIAASCYPGDCGGQGTTKQPLEGRRNMNIRIKANNFLSTRS